MEFRMQQAKEKWESDPFSIIAVILTRMVLELAITLHDFYSQLRDIVQTLLHLLVFRVSADLKEPKSQPLGHELNSKDDARVAESEDMNSLRLSGGEVQMVMERLGLCCSPDGNELHKGMEPDQIVGLFDEQEPSLEEVKEAFDVFDRNRDGLIDARELSELLCSFGLGEVGEDECRRLIRAFDENGDGVIDLGEFTKLVERSLH